MCYCETNWIVRVIVHVSINCVTKFFPPQGLVAGTVIGILILGKIVWHWKTRVSRNSDDLKTIVLSFLPVKLDTISEGSFLCLIVFFDIYLFIPFLCNYNPGSMDFVSFFFNF